MVLSKFDLKAGFWQLVITPEDRPKTTFCIPDHHYQWKVMPFGLKNAPSAFQKAMVKIFDPILSNALVYIDDILLFSPDEQSHVELLAKFHSIVKKYGIMLSEKKMVLGVTSIDFLGMKIQDGKYQPQQHVAQELHKFPDKLTSQKEVQQFLGLVNYMADFLPKLSDHTVHLFPMLKKNPPTWAERQTQAVKDIKVLADKMPPLKIPSLTDKRILQTDASDSCWGAVLIAEDKDKVRSVCGYKSGTFKDSEQHYHSTYKEILAVKKGIEKFQFHLVGHSFLIEMDMSSFPKMLHFKQKMLPEAQLLRWANWFSQWTFTVKHIKGTNNVLADFLSRPKVYKYRSNHEHNHPNILPVIFNMEKASTSTIPPPLTEAHKKQVVAMLEAISQPITNDDLKQLPEAITKTIAELALKMRTQLHWQTFLTICLKNYGDDFIKGTTHIHPDYPFLNVLYIPDLLKLPKEALCFLWYLCEAHTIAISFNSVKLLSYLFQCMYGETPPGGRNAFKFLEWFAPGHQWTRMLGVCKKNYIVFIFRKPSIYISPSQINQEHAIVHQAPITFVLDWFHRNPGNRMYKLFRKDDWEELRRKLANANNVSPRDVPGDIMYEKYVWDEENIVAAEWLKAVREYYKTHLRKVIWCAYEGIDDDQSERELELEEYDENLIENNPENNDEDSDEGVQHDPYEDDPSHPDSRWK